MRLRGANVLARALATGDLVTRSGKVEIRYDSKSPKAYHALAENLGAVADAPLLPDEHCVEAEATPPPAKAASSRTAKPAVAVPPVPAGAAVVYADGACSGNPGPAGLGVVVIDGDTRHERSEYLGHGTNNIAELTAIARALELLPDRERAAVIHTDSQYSIGVLTRGWKAKANQELVAQLKAALATRPKVRLVYVPGHSGVVLNERADELARRAIEERASRTETFLQRAGTNRPPV